MGVPTPPKARGTALVPGDEKKSNEKRRKTHACDHGEEIEAGRYLLSRSSVCLDMGLRRVGRQGIAHGTQTTTTMQRTKERTDDRASAA